MWQESMTAAVPGATLSGFRTSVDTTSTSIAFEIHAARYARTISTGYILSLQCIPLPHAPVPGEEIRRHPYGWGSAEQIEVAINWELPDGVEVEGEIEDVAVECPLGSVSCAAEPIPAGLALRAIVVRTGRGAAPSDSASVRELLDGLATVARCNVFLRQP